MRLPGIALEKKFNLPTVLWRDVKVIVLFWRWCSKMLQISETFPAGILICIFKVSISKPKKIRHIVGLDLCQGLRECPYHGIDYEMCIIRFGSDWYPPLLQKWSRLNSDVPYLSWIVFLTSHSKNEKKVSNILQAMKQPKGNILSMW
jgi:hypothetical protein